MIDILRSPQYQKKVKSQNQPAKTAVDRLRETHCQISTSSTTHHNTGTSYAQVTKNAKQLTKNDTQVPESSEPSLGDIVKMLINMQAEFRNNIETLSKRLEKVELELTKAEE